MSRYRYILPLFFLFTFVNVSYSQQDIYWVGGQGNWNDPNMWYKDPEGDSPAGQIPNNGSFVHFTEFSGLDGKVVMIPPGNYDVYTIAVETNEIITIELQGMTGNTVAMNVYRDLTLLPSVTLKYSSLSSFHNKWIFTGTEDHEIQTAGKDLLSIEIHNAGVEFNQADDLEASAQIRMFGGIWNSNGHDVQSEFIWFRDNNGSSNAESKIFNTSGSSIFCDEWNSQLTYGSLTVNGDHKIYVEVFTGSPRQLNGPSFEFDEIILEEYTDDGSTQVSTYNFLCTDCILNKLIIEDTGITKLADKFTINEELNVKNNESIIQFASGNGRIEEVVINGTVNTPPVSGCETRTIFENRHSDYITLIRDSGTLTISNAIVNNIKTQGAATFYLSNGLLQGASIGWDLINEPPSLNYYWKGVEGVADWDQVDNWIVNGNPALCLPFINDNVFIDENSKGGIRIPPGYSATCNDFTWSNADGFELILDGTNISTSRLTIGGNMYLDNSTSITANQRHELTFSSFTSNSIQTEGVNLPDIRFLGEIASWSLQDDLSCNELIFEGGTLNTNGNDVFTDYWLSLSRVPKLFNFSSSIITVNGEMSLSATEDYNVSVNPGTSRIVCDKLVCFVHELYNVEFTNTLPRTLNNYEYTFNRLFLNGTGQITLQNDMNLSDLIFEEDGSALALDVNSDFIISGEIGSLTSSGDPGILKSRISGTRAEVTKLDGNLCARGPIAFEDIEMTVEGVSHAPNGTDNGNNLDISFIPFPASQNTPLYWLGNTKNWALRSNWSSVSGGCSTNFNPNNRPSLVFDEHSAYLNNEVILFAVTNTNRIEFKNLSNEFIMDNRVELNFQDLLVENSWIRFIGKDYEMSNRSTIQNGTTLDIRARSMTANEWRIPDIGTFSLIVLRNGSKLVEN